MSSILMVGNFLSASIGTRSVCEDLADRLSGSGWTVIRTSTKKARIPKLLDMIRTAWNHRAEYRIAQVDVYSGAAFFWAEAVCAILRRLKKPYILTLHGGNLVVFAHRWRRRVSRLLKSAYAVTTPSNFLHVEMKPYCDSMMLIPNPVDLQHFSYRERTKAEPRLIWLRAFHEIYNPQMAVDVLLMLRSKFPDTTLMMVGPDKDGTLKKVQDYAEMAGLSECIQFAGSVSRVEVPKYLNNFDIFINTTNVDNTPVSILEAMSCGLCIVSTNVGGLPYMLQHERNALLVPPRNPQAMASEVIRILSDDQLASRLSSTAASDAKQSDWNLVLPQWESLIHSTGIKKGSLPPAAGKAS